MWEVSRRCPRKYAPEVSRKCLGRVSAISPTESTPTTRQCDRSAATWQTGSSREEEGGPTATRCMPATPSSGREDGHCAASSEHRVSTRGCEYSHYSGVRYEYSGIRVLSIAGWKTRVRSPLLGASASSHSVCSALRRDASLGHASTPRHQLILIN